MANAKLAPFLYDDAVSPYSATGLIKINPGDWVGGSAQWAIPMHDATIGSPAYRMSGFGIALEPNPTTDPQGRFINNSGLAVIHRGVFRVSAQDSGTARTIPIGSFVYPDTTGSGINGLTGGNTGATGVAASWSTAPPVGISAAIGALTATIASGVAVVIDHPVGGDVGVGQIDIRLNLATNMPYI